MKVNITNTGGDLEALLKKGAKEWNEFRSAELHQHDLIPDISHVDLSNLDLRGANLWLIKARGTNFTNADLRGVDLSWADLSESIFAGANLTAATLRGANLSCADLAGADLEGAVFSETIFTNTNLDDVKGLASCTHMSQSFIDFFTLSSQTNIPRKFLIGCGLPDILLDYLPNILSKPIKLQSCFISYCDANREIAGRLYESLQEEGIRCWYAPESLKIGERFRIGIDKAIHIHDKLLLILSEQSIASHYVEQEVESALDRERKTNSTILFPIRIDNAVLDAELGWPALIKHTRHIGDFSGVEDSVAYENAFRRLLRDLR